MGNEEYRQEGINMQLKPIKDKIEALELAIKNSPPNSHLKEQIAELQKRLDEQLQNDMAFKIDINELKEEFNKLKQLIPMEWQQKHNTKGIINLEDVLQDHLKSHIVVARDQLTNKDKIIIFREFDKAIEDQLKKLDSKPKTEKKECEKKVYCNQCSDFINKFLFGGKAYCKQGYNCYEHAKTLMALFPNKEASGGSKSVVEGQDSNLPSSVKLTDTEEKLPEPQACFNCYYLIDSNECNNKHAFSFKEFIFTTFTTGICNNYRPKEKAEPELINTSEPLYPKVVYQLGTDSKEYIKLKEKYDKLIEGFLREIVELYFSLGDDKVKKFKFASLKQEYEGRLKK